MPRIFLSYRREDSRLMATVLSGKLAERFGRQSVFVDVDSIPAGADFRKHLVNAVEQCDVLLALIGSKWLEASDSRGQSRLGNPADFVRIEIESALSRDIPVIPVLIDGVPMPREDELPPELKEFAFRNALEIHSGRDFSHHIDRVLQEIGRSVGSQRSDSPPIQNSPKYVPPSRSRSFVVGRLFGRYKWFAVALFVSWLIYSYLRMRLFL